jgi:hypothetical protein
MKTLRIILFSVVIMVLSLGVTACRSTPAQAAGFLASVQLQGPTRAEIEQAVEQVFRENQYELVHAAPEFVFDRKAGTMKMLAYGSLSGKGVYSRAKVTIKNDGFGGFIVGCNPYVVRDRGDPVFEEEQKLIKFNGGEYQKRLDDVKKRLETRIR